MSFKTQAVTPDTTTQYVPNSQFTNILAQARNGDKPLTAGQVRAALIQVVKDDKTLTEAEKAAEIKNYEAGNFVIPSKRYDALAEKLGGVNFQKYTPKSTWYVDNSYPTDDDFPGEKVMKSHRVAPRVNFDSGKSNVLTLSDFVSAANAQNIPPESATPKTAAAPADSAPSQPDKPPAKNTHDGKPHWTKNPKWTPVDADKP